MKHRTSKLQREILRILREREEKVKEYPTEVNEYGKVTWMIDGRWKWHSPYVQLSEFYHNCQHVKQELEKKELLGLKKLRENLEKGTYNCLPEKQKPNPTNIINWTRSYYRASFDVSISRSLRTLRERGLITFKIVNHKIIGDIRLNVKRNIV